jgi:hypothetical protein
MGSTKALFCWIGTRLGETDGIVLPETERHGGHLDRRRRLGTGSADDAVQLGPKCVVPLSTQLRIGRGTQEVSL